VCGERNEMQKGVRESRQRRKDLRYIGRGKSIEPMKEREKNW
jgi:hypothetical protein